MATKKPDPKINIQSKYACELTTKVTIDNTAYIVHTEEVGKSRSEASSRVFLDGKIVFSRKADYSHLAGQKDLKRMLSAFMESLHKSVIDEFSSSLIQKQMGKNDYFENAKKLLKKQKGEEALALLQEGLGIYPGDPFLLSYYGCLRSIVSDKPREGIKLCRDAIRKLNQTIPVGREYFYPTFYLNLGRAFLGAGRKIEAVRAFNAGLKADPEDSELLSEMKKLGSRRKPPISFLRRGNPINKYIGSLVHKVSGGS